MYRGQLSAQPQLVVALDWRVLIDAKYGDNWFANALPQLMLDSGMEARVRKLLPLREGAKWWLERNWERRFCVVTVGTEILVPSIVMIVGDYVAEFEHFENRAELQSWLAQTPEIARFYTMDPSLVGLDDTVRLFGGWGETV